MNRDKIERARRELYIYDFAINAAHRAIARDRGASVIYVQADHGDEAAIALYARLGVREDVLHFDIDVET